MPVQVRDFDLPEMSMDAVVKTMGSLQTHHDPRIRRLAGKPVKVLPCSLQEASLGRDKALTVEISPVDNPDQEIRLAAGLLLIEGGTLADFLQPRLIAMARA